MEVSCGKLYDLCTVVLIESIGSYHRGVEIILTDFIICVVLMQKLKQYIQQLQFIKLHHFNEEIFKSI